MTVCKTVNTPSFTAEGRLSLVSHKFEVEEVCSGIVTVRQISTALCHNPHRLIQMHEIPCVSLCDSRSFSARKPF